MKLSEITPEALELLDAEREQVRLTNLLRESVMVAGAEWIAACRRADEMELECMLRARRLVDLGFDRAEIRDLFGVSAWVVKRWLKGVGE